MQRRRLVLIVITVFVLIGLSGLALGLAHFGGPERLLLRVRAEFGLEPTREPLVPTPLPTPLPRSTMTSTATPTAEPTAAAVPTTATSVPSALPSVTLQATSTPSALPTPTATPTTAYLPAQAAAALQGQLVHEWQTWNNCGPATLAMYLSYYGKGLCQDDVREVIRPNWEDKHADVHEMAEFARQQGLNALVRINGDAQLLRLLLSNEVPVMVATWHIDSKGEQMGHYRLIAGYDDATQEWLVWDSLEVRGVSADKPYVGVHMSYDEMARFWPVYNSIYLIVYDDAHAQAVQGIVGADLDDAAMWRRAIESSEAWTSAEPDNGFAWFTLGTNLLHNGRPDEAAAAYDHARQIGLPYRMMWYQFGALEAYYQVGRYDEVIALADATIRVTSDVEELHYWRALALEAQGDLAGARAALRTALEKKANYAAAQAELERLGE